MELQRMREHLTSSLQDCHTKRTKYLDELTNLSKKLDTTGVDRLRGEIEAKMSVVHSTISKVKATIERYENRLKECQFREHEAQYGDQDQPASQDKDDVVVESSREESGASSGSPNRPNSPEAQPQAEADAKGTQAGASEGNLAISPEEEKILMGDQTPTTGESLVSDTASVYTSAPGA